MNRQQLKKTEGQRVRLQLPATGPRGEVLDDDWIVRRVTDDAVELVHTERNAVTAVGLDHVSSYFSDATRSTDSQRYGSDPTIIGPALSGQCALCRGAASQ